MEWLADFSADLITALIGSALTAVAAWLGGILGKIWKEKMRGETLRQIAGIAVSAVEMMYREAGGEEKLEHALSLAEELLEERGVTLPRERLRIFLEAALAEMKGAFDKA